MMILTYNIIVQRQESTAEKNLRQTGRLIWNKTKHADFRKDIDDSHAIVGFPAHRGYGGAL